MSEVKVVAYIGLGSNLDDPVRQVSDAITELGQLAECRCLAVSSLYRSAPMGPQDQPDYINAVVALETHLDPHALLKALQELERLHRRERKQHWGPRTLDLDILLYGSEVIADDRLIVPHPGVVERNFVLIPLAEIAPELRLPDNRSVAALVDVCSQDGLERLNH